MSVTFKIKSVSKNPRLAEQYRELLAALVKKTAFDIEADAKSLAPVDTGFLKGSIQAVPDESNDLQATVTVGAEYGVHVEYGTKYMPAQPYFRPAVEVAKRAWVAATRSIFRRK